MLLKKGFLKLLKPVEVLKKQPLITGVTGLKDEALLEAHNQLAVVLRCGDGRCYRSKAPCCRCCIIACM
jgi:hypothetical protein